MRGKLKGRGRERSRRDGGSTANRDDAVSDARRAQMLLWANDQGSAGAGVRDNSIQMEGAHADAHETD